ncbi:hypothetical protein OAO01_08810 [Oligoflexia bacterium]|nr:hypothetical protein [Oligoflexia bacterium]
MRHYLPKFIVTFCSTFVLVSAFSSAYALDYATTDGDKVVKQNPSVEVGHKTKYKKRKTKKATRAFTRIGKMAGANNQVAPQKPQPGGGSHTATQVPTMPITQPDLNWHEVTGSFELDKIACVKIPELLTVACGVFAKAARADVLQRLSDGVMPTAEEHKRITTVFIIAPGLIGATTARGLGEFLQSMATGGTQTKAGKYIWAHTDYSIPRHQDKLIGAVHSLEQIRVGQGVGSALIDRAVTIYGASWMCVGATDGSEGACVADGRLFYTTDYINFNKYTTARDMLKYGRNIYLRP